MSSCLDGGVRPRPKCRAVRAELVRGHSRFSLRPKALVSIFPGGPAGPVGRRSCRGPQSVSLTVPPEGVRITSTPGLRAKHAAGPRQALSSRPPLPRRGERRGVGRLVGLTVIPGPWLRGVSPEGLPAVCARSLGIDSRCSLVWCRPGVRRNESVSDALSVEWPRVPLLSVPDSRGSRQGAPEASVERVDHRPILSVCHVKDRSEKKILSVTTTGWQIGRAHV